ncbi:MDR family MFS transporter [Winogradskya humida]|uniref:MDR family MFS transporter n=1 Tax=Winogradskya humida TaxID=113566 RepID=UPI001EF3C271|nr:MDR family MFS transporter [Actinoplanes humidus]
MTLVATPPPPVTGRRLTLISLVLVLGLSTTLLDTTIVNIALEHLRAVFHASVGDAQWLVTGYLLAYVAVIPVSGWVSERFGARNAWMFAVAAFLAGSILCGLATSLPALIAFRVLQGIGGGMLMPISISILTRAAGPDRIEHAMIAVALPAPLAPILGSVLGGTILEYASWRWLFLINVPICLAALALAPILLPAGQGQRGHRLDILGFLLLTPGVAAIAYGISQATGADGFASTGAWLPIVAGVVLLAAFTIHSLRTRDRALIDVRVFTRRSFGLSSVITFANGFSLYALMFMLPLFYQQVRGETVLHTGLLLIPQAVGTVSFFVLARKLVAHVDGRLVVATGVLLTMAGVLPFALAGLHGGTALLLAGQFVQGIGFGAIMQPVMTLAFASLTHDEAPRASAAFSVVQRVGSPFGVAVIAVILQTMLSSAITPADGLAAFTGAFWWIFGLSAVPLLFVFLLPARKSAAHTESGVVEL